MTKLDNILRSRDITLPTNVRLVKAMIFPVSDMDVRVGLPWDSPGKNTGVGRHLLLQCMKVKVKLLSRVRLFATPWTAALQAPPFMGFSRQEYWSGVPLPSPGFVRGWDSYTNE